MDSQQAESWAVVRNRGGLFIRKESYAEPFASVVHIYGRSTRGFPLTSEDREEAERNVTLMAAAPALLAACLDALKTCEDDMQHVLDNGRLRSALQAAILKATTSTPEST